MAYSRGGLGGVFGLGGAGWVPEVCPVWFEDTCSRTYLRREAVNDGVVLVDWEGNKRTMSAPPNSFSATTNMFSNSGHCTTFVFTNTARAFPVGDEYSSTSFCASGRRPRSAITTLQLRESKSLAKE